jgi:shikimate dehydrogenase
VVAERRAAVLGSPVAHSLSPALHHAAYAALGLPWRYDAVECTQDGLAALLDDLGPEWAGLSLTMPLKQAVLPLLPSVSPLARDVAAANTLVRRDGGWHGDNTDVHGIVAALREAGAGQVVRAVVLGGGATARSALAALRELGAAEVVLVVRSEPTETLAAAARLGVRVTVVPASPEALAGAVAGADLVVSTLPPGAADGLAGHCADVPLLLDVVYAPWPTALAGGCRGTVVGGAAMLLHQAARQVELMTGCDAPLEAMRAALT